MNNTLKLYKEVIDEGELKILPFPGSGQIWAYISDYKYSAARMSSAPSITTTLKWPSCLDKEWDASVFVEYNGERYFVKNTPSSSYDNTSRLYSHELNLVSERAVLDSVYFLNVATKTSDEGENPQGDSLSSSSEFSFSGDINEFIDRLNRSLVQSGIGGGVGYTAIVDEGAVSETKLFSISNQYVTDVLKSAYELYGVPYYFVGKEIHFGAQQNDIQTPLRYGANDSLLSISKTNLNKQVVTRITGYGSSRNIPYYYPNPTPKGKIYLESTSKTARFAVEDDMLFCNNMDLDRWVEYTGVDYSVDIEEFLASSDGKTYNSYNGSDLFNAEFRKDVWVKFNFYVEHDFTDTYIDCSFATTDRGVRPFQELYVDSALMGKDGAIQTKFVDGMVHCGKLTKASYTMTLHLRYPYAGSATYAGYFRIKNLNKAFWRIDGTGKTFDLNKASIYITSGVPKHGDRIKQSLEYRIDVKNALMPSEYRRTFGENMWYNATNDPDRGDWYGDVQFNHPYNSNRPAEYIHSDDEIYPTIKGMTNVRNEYIDTFLDITFDKYDNNEIYPEDYEDEKLAGKYKHPYFFVKLKKTDGPNGFNLFDHAIEGETMKISFTTGHVAGCEFEIGVDEETHKNPVQVDENGDLVRDENDNVVIRGSYIDSQQNTQNNEVWLALKKEDSTMGVLMPDATAGLIPLSDLSPNGGDTFVILGIHLPEAYITAAEDRLERKLIEYLYDNNDERFSFSIKFSSIYLAENSDLASIINENCRVRLIYDNVEYAMFATSCSITVKEGVALPEVTLNIDNELKLVKPKVKDVSAIIAATEKKIKEVKDSTAEVRTSVLGANISTKDNAEKIRQLQDEKVSEADLESLEYNINGQSGLYNTKENVKMPVFYAATDAGTKDQILQSTGLGAPRWVDVSKLAGVNADWSNIGSKPTTIKGYGITDCYTKKEVNPTIEKASSALQYITSPEPEDGDYISLSVGEKTGSNTQEVSVAAHIAKLNTSADGLVTASDARAYVEQAKAEVAENIERVESTVTTRLIPSQSAMLGLPNKVMTWNGSAAMMSLPIANGLDDWGSDASPYGYLVTDQQVQAKIDSMANKDEVVDFAKDLTGVIEARPEEFTYRPSAGNRSIRDASALIRRIKGNTVVFAQLSDHTSSLQREGDWSVAVEVTTSTWGTFSSPVQVIANHKYLFYINKKDGRSITDTYTLLKGAHTVYFDEPLFVTAEETATWRWTARYQTSTNGLRFQTQAFDLTRLFGAGYEPKTIEEFKSSFPDSYYPYSEPKVRNVMTTLITTIGFNQWDEQWELGALSTADGTLLAHHERGRSVNFFDVVPNASYYCATIAPTTTNSSGTVGSMGVWWYDSSRTMIKYEDITNKPCVAPSNARYAKICSYGGDVNAIFNGGVNINLSHSKVRNGEYEPYKKNIRLLPEIYKYFPDGMNGNANVWDEINSEKAIKRWEVVDLGSLTWKVQQASVNIFWSDSVAGLKKAPYGSYPNAISIFDTGRFSDLQVAKSNGVTTEIISIHDNQARILLYNPNYEATTEGAAQLKASLDGVLLYYELAEQEYTDITEPMQLDYEVEDFGTEKALSLASSAPFRADIVYQFNAEGRIRDNSRNIERVESNIQKVESTVTTRLIPSQSAMLGLPNKVMIWNGSTAMMSLPIAEDIDHWDLEESVLGTIPTSQQVREYIKSITDNLTPSQSATLESSNRVMVWNGDYTMTSLPIAANFAQWGAGAIPTGQQVIDYISAIKGSLATGLTTKETLTIGASGYDIIGPNIVYEIITKSSTAYNYDLYLLTTNGVDVIADNEWRIRIDTRNGFSGRIGIEPSGSGYSISWAYPEDVNLGAGTAPTIKADFIYDIQFRMIGKTLLGSYKKYR